jgi:hypothetical protein
VQVTVVAWNGQLVFCASSIDKHGASRQDMLQVASQVVKAQQVSEYVMVVLFWAKAELEEPPVFVCWIAEIVRRM